MAKIISSTNGAFKLYPRGFLGTMQSPTIEKTNTNVNSEMVGRLHFDVAMFDAAKSTRITANMTIDGLYRELIRKGTANFDFREKVMVAALHAFGTPSFYNWYRVQFESPAFGQTNRRFLDDTFKFLRTGRRDLSLQTWISLVKADEPNPGDHVYGEWAADFFGAYNTSENQKISCSIPELLQTWVSREGGFNDLLLTLFILFGVSD